MKKKLQGKIVSDKMDKTIIVQVDRFVAHPLYKKKYKVSKKYRVHDEKNEYNEGDSVEIEATKPISKEKRWRVVKKVN